MEPVGGDAILAQPETWDRRVGRWWHSGAFEEITESCPSVSTSSQYLCDLKEVT